MDTQGLKGSKRFDGTCKPDQVAACTGRRGRCTQPASVRHCALRPAPHNDRTTLA